MTLEQLECNLFTVLDNKLIYNDTYKIVVFNDEKDIEAFVNYYHRKNNDVDFEHVVVITGTIGSMRSVYTKEICDSVVDRIYILDTNLIAVLVTDEEESIYDETSM